MSATCGSTCCASFLSARDSLSKAACGRGEGTERGVVTGGSEACMGREASVIKGKWAGWERRQRDLRQLLSSPWWNLPAPGGFSYWWREAGGRGGERAWEARGGTERGSVTNLIYCKGNSSWHESRPPAPPRCTSPPHTPFRCRIDLCLTSLGSPQHPPQLPAVPPPPPALPSPFPTCT